jgi:hypothetical protein
MNEPDVGMAAGHMAFRRGFFRIRFGLTGVADASRLVHRSNGHCHSIICRSFFLSNFQYVD